MLRIKSLDNNMINVINDNNVVVAVLEKCKDYYKLTEICGSLTLDDIKVISKELNELNREQEIKLAEKNRSIFKRFLIWIKQWQI